MIYSYNQYRNDESFHKIPDTKWKIEECDNDMIQECIDKKLTVVEISFGDEFNEPIEAVSGLTSLEYVAFGKRFNKPIKCLSKCVQLKHIVFGEKFNKSIQSIAHCTNLQQITFEDDFNSESFQMYKSSTNYFW